MRTRWLSTIILAAVMVLVCGARPEAAPPPAPGPGEPGEGPPPPAASRPRPANLGSISWETSFAAARARAGREGKPILLLYLFGRLDEDFC
jgi:hypothetical protein